MTNTKMYTHDRPTFDSIDELATALRVGRNKIYEMLKDGTIPAIRHGRRYVIPRTAVDAWLASAVNKDS